MNKKRENRLSQNKIREIILKNADELLSEECRVEVIEISGKKKIITKFSNKEVE